MDFLNAMPVILFSSIFILIAALPEVFGVFTGCFVRLVMEDL